MKTIYTNALIAAVAATTPTCNACGKDDAKLYDTKPEAPWSSPANRHEKRRMERAARRARGRRT